MKTSRLRWLLVALIVFVVLLGGSGVEISNVRSWFQPAEAPTGFSAAHARLAVPTLNEDDFDCRNGREHSLPAPTGLYLRDYEKILYDFILRRKYDEMKWCVDKKVRDTGPWIEGTYYGVHPAVRIYYSPRMMYWLTGDPDYWQEGKASGQALPRPPRTGPVPDGAMIVKEMYMPPAELYAELQRLMAQNPKPDCSKDETYQRLLSRLITAWTVMVKDSKGSHDGWFWAGPGAPRMVNGRLQTIKEAIDSQLDDYDNIAEAGFGLTCIRCHASADTDLTFSALRNIEGFSVHENLLTFRVDNSWRNKSYFANYPLMLLSMQQPCLEDSLVRLLFELPTNLRPFTESPAPEWEEFMRFHLPQADPPYNLDRNRLPAVNPAFAAMYPQIGAVAADQVRKFPMQWADHVVAGAQVRPYITSDNCLGCHGGLGGNPYDVAMFVQTGPNYGDGYNISEYGEWRWSPMGLAGRDPVFYAQLESEMALLERDAQHRGLLKGSLKDNQQQVTNTCLSCHGSMGQRQLELDAKTDPTLNPNFQVDYVYLVELLSAAEKKPDNYRYHIYGELAREGISCMTCHHITGPDTNAVKSWQPPQRNWINGSTPKEQAYFLFHNTTGRFNNGPADVIFGPLDSVAIVPMKNAIGITPKFNAFIRQSQMCGGCHTINLPNIGMTDNPFPVLTAAEQNPALQPYAHTLEQETFVEWQNSAFANTVNGKPAKGFKSCQDCHMPGGFESLGEKINIPQVTTKIATIQDTDYPEVDNRAPDADIHVPLRPDYRRHEHVGLNVFMLEMFNQFPEVLGVAKQDYMTSAKTGNTLAIENMLRQAEQKTVDLSLQVGAAQGNQLPIEVTVQNKTGHRFPSGVAFRRAFLELLVLDGEDVVWASGRTNSVGVIVDGAGCPLKTEFLPDATSYQPHYQTIDRQDQVQIYEELEQDASFLFTTSFIHRVHPIKDNRLLPIGWRSSDYFKDQGEVIYQFMESTDPEVHDDPDYADQGPGFPGLDRLRYVATLPDGVNRANLSVRITMYYQSIPPYYLYQRFSTAPNGPATQRLYYLCSRLSLDDTPMAGWKLPLVSLTAQYDATGRKWMALPATGPYSGRKVQ